MGIVLEGRIYNWETAMKVCPEGWHLPSDEEWQELVNFVGKEIAGKKLKARSGWVWDRRYGSGNGTDDYGFAALPDVLGFGDGSFLRGDRFDGVSGRWWSSTKYTKYNNIAAAYIWSIYFNDTLADRAQSFDEIECSCSVRCVQDIGPKADAPNQGNFTDSRDGKIYKTVKIGNQVWMAENLNYETEGSKYYKYELLASSDSSTSSNSSSASSSGCYIATAVYGSYDCPEVWTLRRFRDNELSNLWLGRCFIRIYYAVSPKIVELFGNKKWFSKLWKPIIDKIVRKLQKENVI
jgi:uncharacterized protein (TIGR02145 family)